MQGGAAGRNGTKQAAVAVRRGTDSPLPFRRQPCTLLLRYAPAAQPGRTLLAVV